MPIEEKRDAKYLIKEEHKVTKAETKPAVAEVANLPQVKVEEFARREDKVESIPEADIVEATNLIKATEHIKVAASPATESPKVPINQIKVVSPPKPKDLRILVGKMEHPRMQVISTPGTDHVEKPQTPQIIKGKHRRFPSHYRIGTGINSNGASKGSHIVVIDPENEGLNSHQGIH